MSRDLPIGVFDSGVGGLTVAKALLDALPSEELLYLGDTARLPYGTKSPDSINRYAAQATKALAARGVKLLVVACNTASAVALPALTRLLAPTPVVGVVHPGAEAAVAAGKRHLVLATEATVRLHAYRDALLELDETAEVDELPCELLVALAEEGWTDGDITRSVIRRYLSQRNAFQPDVLILGCTHFPLLRPAIRAVAPANVAIVDSATTTAAAVSRKLAELDIARPSTERGGIRFFATDGPSRFARVGGLFLGTELLPADIELIDL